MIGTLRGRVTHRDTDHVIIETGGVGYIVQCHLRTLAALHDVDGEETALVVHTSVSDDAIRLFGFLTRDELLLFELLIGVERIGPKAALGILGRAELPTLLRAIRSGDAALLATVPGIGPKTAERVVLELRDKVHGLALPVTPAVAARSSDAVETAIAGLVGLGFREPDARAAIDAARDGDGENDIAALVGRALRHLDAQAVR